MSLRNKISILALAVMGYACTTPERKTIGTFERLDPAFDGIVSPEAKAEIIAEGYDWSEGPLWIESEQMLLYSDVPKNTVYKWTEEKGAEKYLEPSGYTSATPRGGEMGSNGLLLDEKGNLVLCQHGDRRLARMSAPLNAPSAEFEIIAGDYNGMRFSSPNDATMKDGVYYLTDPPYGLRLAADTIKETTFNGVYRISSSGVKLLVDSISRPNGIDFSPDGKYLYVASSDPAAARWYRYEMNDTAVVSGKILYDATSNAATEKGLPDGLKVDSHGTLFATGPGGVWIFNADGKVLGKLKLPDPTSNCALSADEKTLYVTNDGYILRIKMRP